MQAITRFFVDRWQLTLVLFAMLLALGVGSVGLLVLGWRRR